MPKLLNKIKESGLSHEDVIKLIENEVNKKIDKPESENKTEVETSSDSSEIDKTEVEKEAEKQVELILKEEEAKKAQEELVKAEALKKLKADEEFKKQVDLEIKRILAVKRKVPSKGELSDEPSKAKPTVKKSMFERIV